MFQLRLDTVMFCLLVLAHPVNMGLSMVSLVTFFFFFFLVVLLSWPKHSAEVVLSTGKLAAMRQTEKNGVLEKASMLVSQQYYTGVFKQKHIKQDWVWMDEHLVTRALRNRNPVFLLGA